MDNLKQKIFKNIELINQEAIQVRHEIHSHPELSGSEKGTRDLVKTILSRYGYKIREFKNHFGLVVEHINNPKLKTVAIRADMDALPMDEQTNVSYSSTVPNVMHACGHDSHTAIALGLAMAIGDIKDKLNGNIKFIFQPSEETKDGGSSELIEDGALDNVDMIFGLHAYPYLKTGQVGYKYGVMMASADVFTIEVFGKSSHGARPHEGVDAILVTSMIVNSLNHIVSRRIDPLHPAVISLGTIEGGTAPNIICNHVLLKGTVRTINEEVRKNISNMMKESIDGVCKSMGANYNFDYEFGQPELINGKAATDIIVQSACEVVSDENCIDLVDPVMGGEDFSEYLQKVSGAFFRLGTCSEDKGTCVPQHNSRFNVDDDALKIGMKILGLSVLKALK
ncbi:MAG: amidohydrolase [Arcobacteraceae bacterium]|nr:amidohydrolase [Arcobacteraceae bacterium]